jgi:hypothetical protein
VEIKDIIILILIGFILLSYYKPDTGKQIQDKIASGVSSIVGEAKDTLFGPKCSSVIEEVCADGVTYTNACYAEKAGKETYTPGACT